MRGLLPFACLWVIGVASATVRAAPPDTRCAFGPPDHATVDGMACVTRGALSAALPPGLRPFLDPVPPLGGRDGGRSPTDRLAWLATLAHRVNDAYHYAESSAWRRIGPWTSGPTIASPERSPGRFPVWAGREDPAVDFAASVAAANLRPHEFACDFPLRARFLAQRGLMQTPLATDEGRCLAVRRWLDINKVAGVDVVFATPTWSDPSASLGHVLFRIRLVDDTAVVGDSFAPTFAWVANDDLDNTADAIWRGVTGQLEARVHTSTMAVVYHNYVRLENRALVFYELNLSREEVVDLVHAVSAQRRLESSRSYAFFTDNCASLAWDTLSSILVELKPVVRLFAHPHGVISALVTAGRARPVGVIHAPRGRALNAERARDGLAEKLLSSAPSALRAASAIRAAFARLHGGRDANLDRRLAVTSDFATALASAPASDFDGAASDLAAYIDALVEIESHLVDLAAGAATPNAPSAILDLLFHLRARLPPASAPPLVPLSPRPIRPSGSRLATLTVGQGAGRVAFIGLSMALIEEEAGPLRAVMMRAAGRVALLRNHLELGVDARHGLHLRENRTTIVDVAAFGDGLRTGVGPVAGRVGMQGAVELVSRPVDGLDAAFLARGGPTLTLDVADDFRRHLVAGLDVEVGAWGLRDGLNGTLALGLTVEGGIADRATGTALRVRLRVAPTLVVPLAWALTVEGRLFADLVIDRERGIIARPSLTFRVSDHAYESWSAGIGVLW